MIPQTDWPQVIHDAAITQMNAQVTAYESTITSGVEAIAVIWSGKARVQHIREPRDATQSYGESKTRRFRFQLDPDDVPPFFPSGTTFRVTDGGRDPQLEGLVYVVDSAVNSSHMAVRTVELRSDMIAYPPITWPSV